MKEPQRLLRIPVLNAQPGTQNAQRIGGDCNRNAHQGENGAPKSRFLQKVSIEDRKREKAHQRTDAATGLRHLQPHCREFDDIPLAQHRYPEYREQRAGQL